MRKVLLAAMALTLLPLTAKADGFDLRETYDRMKGFAERLFAPEPPQRGMAEVPAAAIDPKMALVPGGEGRMRVIAPPGSPGGNPKFDPR